MEILWQVRYSRRYLIKYMQPVFSGITQPENKDNIKFLPLKPEMVTGKILMKC